MNQIRTFLMKGLRKVYLILSGKTFPDPECIIDREMANKVIFKHMTSPEPCMLSRFGSIELSCVITYMKIHDNSTSYWEKLCDFITDKTDLPWWREDFLFPIFNNAGVFPPSFQTLDGFAKRYLDDLPLIDILASVNYKEKFVQLAPDVDKVHFETIYPFFVENPWTRALKGKRVLIIHPCVETIKKQYSRREKLFDNPDILPEFELLTLKSVQSACGEKTGFKDWFEALAVMEKQIDQMDFDVAILGCGAYGLPLAAHIKRNGKKAIHLGGGTQLLFGIKGRRWENNYSWTYKTPVKLNMNYTDLYNDYWIRPLAEEIPTHANRVENACYW